MKRIILIGAGSQAHIVLDMLTRSKQYEVLGLLDDTQGFVGRQVLGTQIIGTLDDLSSFDPKAFGFVVCMGNNTHRKKIYDHCCDLGFEPLSIIGASAIISEYSSIGKGTIIGELCSIQPEVTIGDNVILGPTASVAHNSVLEDHIHLSSGVKIAGRVHLGESVDMGTAASAIPDVVIGQGSIIGAGAAVIKDIPEGKVAVGVPAKVIKSVDVNQK